MSEHDKVNILMVDDEPAKLLSYEVILSELGENLIKAGSGREALEHLLKTDIAVVLMDVSMPEIDGFELAEIIRQHPRYQKMAIIFISAVHMTDLDRLKGYEYGAVDYIAVPVIPDLLRAKVSVFAELYRKTRQLERLNGELEQRVAERTEELQRKVQELAQLNTTLQRTNQELKAFSREKEVLLKEVHHRVKNNLQIISSLLSLQVGAVTDPKVLQVFRESQHRVRAMALIHEKLYQSPDLVKVDFGENVQSLTGYLFHSFGVERTSIALKVYVKDVFLEVEKAIPCGLIVNELVSNALKHAFPAGRPGEIRIDAQAEGTE